jgi:hypothetical protein
MVYKIAATKPNPVVEIEVWRQSDKTFTVELSWSSGYVLVDKEPKLPESYDHAQGIDVNLAFDPFDGSLYDAYAKYNFSENITQGEQELMLKMYEDSMHEGLISLGWKQVEAQCWFYGELEITPKP